MFITFIKWLIIVILIINSNIFAFPVMSLWMIQYWSPCIRHNILTPRCLRSLGNNIDRTLLLYSNIPSQIRILLKRRYRIGNRIVQITRLYSSPWIRHRVPLPFIISPSDHPRTCCRNWRTLSWRLHSICSCLIAPWMINCLVMLARL